MGDPHAAHGAERLEPGVEYGVGSVGHFGVSGVDLASVPAGDFLTGARARGAFMVVNHPWALPTRIPGAPSSHWDMAYRPWTHGAPGFDSFDGVEICVGGPDAVRAAQRVELTFAGEAQVFVDGEDRGLHRIVGGGSRSGFVYANL